ncbi:MAG: hypothetical protein LH613_15205 [Chamaesiphon sp.]|nr:hypothetical protein [Chamaesiphon sp.]
MNCLYKRLGVVSFNAIAARILLAIGKSRSPASRSMTSGDLCRSVSNTVGINGCDLRPILNQK